VIDGNFHDDPQMNYCRSILPLFFKDVNWQ
jgi:hypothetical protein